jgi:hypothetical protein
VCSFLTTSCMTFAKEYVRETQHFGAVVTAGCDRAASRRQVLETLVCTCEPSHEDIVGGDISHTFRHCHVSRGRCGRRCGNGPSGGLIVGSPGQAARANRTTGVAEWEWGKLRPPAVLNDVHELHDSGQRGEGTPDSRVVEMASHHKVRMSLEQRKHWCRKLGPKFLFNFLLEFLEGVNKFAKVDC